jgi:hypothetical protein
MPTHEHGLYVLWAYSQFGSKECAVPGGVQDPGHADHPIRRELAVHESAIGHYIKRVAHHDDDAIRTMLDHILRYALYNSGVGGNKIIPAHARLPRKTARDHNHIAVCGLGVIVRTTHYAAIEQVDRCGLPNIQGLAFGEAFLDIQQHYFVGEFPTGHGIGASCTHVAGPYHGDFHCVCSRLIG